MQAGKEVIAETSVTEENPEALKGSIEMNVNEQGEEKGTEQETKIARYQELQTQLSEIGKQAQAKVLGELNRGEIIYKKGQTGVQKNSAANNIIPQSEENITPDTKLNQLKGLPKQKKVRRGAFTPAIKAIELFKDADYSTLPHELAHYWLDNMWGYIVQEKQAKRTQITLKVF